MIPLDFHYLWPSGGYLILLSFAGLFLYWVLSRHQKNIPFPRDMIAARSRVIFWTKSILASLALLFCALALMEPVGNGHYPEGVLPPKVKDLSRPVELKRKAHEFIFLIDASGSMEIQDTRLQKTRLEYAKAIADEIIASLTGETASLYAFTSQTLLLSPATLDYLFVRLSLKEIEINEGGIPGTSLFNALAEMQKRYLPPNSAAEEMKLKTLVLLSDGGDTSIEALPAVQQKGKIDELTEQLQDAGRNNLRLYTVGMGSLSGGVVPNISENGRPVESHLEREILQGLAKSGHGRYFEANSYTPSQLVKELLEDVAKDPPYYDAAQVQIQDVLLQKLFANSTVQYDRYYQFPVALALLCLAFVLLFPDCLRGSLFAVGCMFSLTSLSADDSPYEPAMYRAKGYVEAKMFKEARDIYENILNSPLTPFQKAALQYDIGTTYLEEHVWDLAISQLSQLALQTTSWPILDNKIHKNLALAQYEKALSLDQNQTIEKLKRFEIALVVNTFLPPLEREPLQTILKQSIAEMSLIVDHQTLQKGSTRENLQRFLNHLEELQQVLPLMLMPNTSKSLRDQYATLFASEQIPWLNFWEAIKKKIGDYPAALPLVKSIHQSFEKALEGIRRADARVAMEMTVASKENVESLLDTLAEDPLEEKLLQIQNVFKRLLTGNRWKLEEGGALEKLYVAALKLPADADLEKIITGSQQRLEQAFQTAKAGVWPLAKLFAENAEQSIRIALGAIPQSSSMHLLETIIGQQEYALGLIHFQLSQTDSIQNDLLKLIREAQEALLPMAALYYRKLYREQSEAFSRQGLCQAIPWSAALPLFDDARLAAIRADEAIQQPWNGAEIMTFQMKALQAWQKTWVEIENPTSQHSTCFEGSSSKEDPSPTNQESLSTLLQMELDDRKPPVEVPAGANVERPW